MTSLLCIIFSPALLLLSVPLVVFAVFTTTVAFSTLFFRVFIVYAELAVVLLQDQFSRSTSTGRSKSRRNWSDEVKEARRKSRRSSTGSGQSNGGSMTPKAPDSNGLGIYGCGAVERDFEGVGGWRVPSSDDDDILWTSINSRLELPSIVSDRKRNHHRSLTSTGLSSTLISRPPKIPLVRTPTSLYAAGSISPDGYFSSHAMSKSATALDVANFGRVALHRKASSASVISINQIILIFWLTLWSGTMLIDQSVESRTSNFNLK